MANRDEADCRADPCDGCPSAASAEIEARFEREAERGHCPTPRYRMPWFAWGQGPPLVFVHGAADVSRSFVPVIARLTESFRCVAYELPSGRGDERLRHIRHEDLADDLLRLTRRLGLPKAYLFGSSFGSTVVLRALRLAPETFPRAILQGGLAHRPLRGAERWVAALARWLPGTMGDLKKREKVLAAVHKAPFAGRPEGVWRAFVETTGRARIRAFGHQARWLHGLDLRPELSAIRQPVLLIHGELDGVIPLRYAEELRAGLPSSALAVVPGCGHVPTYTHPEALAELIRAFLTPPDAGQSPKR